MQLINFIRKKVFTVYSRLLFNTIMGILKAYLQYKFTAQGEPGYRFLKCQLQVVRCRQWVLPGW